MNQTNKFMHDIRRFHSSLIRIERAHTQCPLTVELGEVATVRLVELVADMDLQVRDVVRLFERLNSGEVLYVLH